MSKDISVNAQEKTRIKTLILVGNDTFDYLIDQKIKDAAADPNKNSLIVDCSKSSDYIGTIKKP